MNDGIQTYLQMWCISDILQFLNHDVRTSAKNKNYFVRLQNSISAEEIACHSC